jgi:hypothetical protein
MTTMRGLTVFFALTASSGLMIGAGACSDDTTSTIAAPDAGLDGQIDASSTEPPIDASDASDGASNCTSLELGDAPTVTPTELVTDDAGDSGIATLTGGTIADGIYVLESVLELTAGNSPEQRTRLRFTGNQFELIEEDFQNGTSLGVQRQLFRYTTKGTTFSASFLCTSPKITNVTPAPATYEATTDSLTLRFTHGQDTYKKQP